MSDHFEMKPRPLAAGQVFEERRRFERQWTEIDDNARYTGVPERHELREVIESERREEIVTAHKVAIDALRVHYARRKQTATADGTTRSLELADRSFTVEAHPPRVIVQGAADDAEAAIVELEYAGLGQAEPVFAAAPPLPIAIGDQVGAMEPLVRGLLYRCARGTVGYTSSTPIVVRSTLRAVEARASGKAGRFALKIEPDVRPGISDRLHFDGTLVIGSLGWPLELRGNGTLTSSILHRRGETKIDARLELAVEWQIH